MTTAEMTTYQYLLERKLNGEAVLPERIVCAANMFSDGSVVLGVRHGCEIMMAQAKSMGKPNLLNTKQGFYTNWQRWVDREQAMEIAIEQNQIYRADGTSNPFVLFSECLY